MAEEAGGRRRSGVAKEGGGGCWAWERWAKSREMRTKITRANGVPDSKEKVTQHIVTRSGGKKEGRRGRRSRVMEEEEEEEEGGKMMNDFMFSLNDLLGDFSCGFLTKTEKMFPANSRSVWPPHSPKP